MNDLKIILKRQMSFTNPSFFLFTIDEEKFKHGIKRTEIDMETFNRILHFIEAEIKKYRSRKQKQFMEKKYKEIKDGKK